MLKTEVVAIIGASDKEKRYAHMAMHFLIEQGHQVVLINPSKEMIAGHQCYASVSQYNGKIDTITLYVNPKRFQEHLAAVIKVAPKRVIMNPGTEDDALEEILVEHGIEVQHACTLVLLSTGKF